MNYDVRFDDAFLGRVITLSNGKIEFSVSLDVGPRIISLKAKGGPDIMYHDVNDYVNKDCSPIYGEGEKWHIYGGHRLWLSPEDLSTYYPDNNPVCYKLTENGISVHPPKWKIIDVQPQIDIEFVGDNKLKITHTVTNLGGKKKLCLWALTVMKAGGTMTFDLPTEDTGFLANRNIVLWSYASMNDSRAEIKDDKIIAKSDVSVPNPYKMGAYNNHIRAEYLFEENGKKTRFVKETEGVKGAAYPDFYCNFESYFSDKIHEIETLSPIVEAEQGEAFGHVEFWEIY
ncbi:MAG TPA: hypothetical protein PKY53_02865 [Clostridia bacterium]|jgi:hypothetical protein|nr:hypothetical protein [Clostridia bacterium]